jgi:hypothetical protein
MEKTTSATGMFTEAALTPKKHLKAILEASKVLSCNVTASIPDAPKRPFCVTAALGRGLGSQGTPR